MYWPGTGTEDLLAFHWNRGCIGLALGQRMYWPGTGTEDVLAWHWDRGCTGLALGQRMYLPGTGTEDVLAWHWNRGCTGLALGQRMYWPGTGTEDVLAWHWDRGCTGLALGQRMYWPFTGTEDVLAWHWDRGMYWPGTGTEDVLAWHWDRGCTGLALGQRMYWPGTGTEDVLAWHWDRGCTGLALGQRIANIFRSALQIIEGTCTDNKHYSITEIQFKTDTRRNEGPARKLTNYGEKGRHERWMTQRFALPILIHHISDLYFFLQITWFEIKIGHVLSPKEHHRYKCYLRKPRTALVQGNLLCARVLRIEIFWILFLAPRSRRGSANPAPDTDRWRVGCTGGRLSAPASDYCKHGLKLAWLQLSVLCVVRNCSWNDPGSRALKTDRRHTWEWGVLGYSTRLLCGLDWEPCTFCSLGYTGAYWSISPLPSFLWQPPRKKKSRNPQKVYERSMCQERDTLVDIYQEYPDEVEFIFKPSCVLLKRCAGCCSDENFECVPTEWYNVTMQI
ncbi:unnamed protein product [Ranitomeya imitator]|uniref:Platelet-derived growth factor (PDGF) family profile domain-containing protein n=1 Tax=Ranitomeya imitator TaxID=111125 RepID=A0ABN9LL85_9NEOB|nr:unnamed protein product [Ranitomeya imitator]